MSAWHPNRHGLVAEGISKHFSQIMLCKWLADSNFGSNLFWINYTNVQQLSFFSSLPSFLWEKPDVGVLGAVVASIMFECLIIKQQLCFCRHLLCWFGSYSYCKKICCVQLMLTRIIIHYDLHWIIFKR